MQETLEADTFTEWDAETLRSLLDADEGPEPGVVVLPEPRGRHRKPECDAGHINGGSVEESSG
jgi:hypothetical protein